MGLEINLVSWNEYTKMMDGCLLLEVVVRGGII